MAEDFPTSVRLPKPVKADLKKFADLQGCAVSWLIVDIISKWIDWRKREDKKK